MPRSAASWNHLRAVALSLVTPCPFWCSIPTGQTAPPCVALLGQGLPKLSARSRNRLSLPKRRCPRADRLWKLCAPKPRNNAATAAVSRDRFCMAVGLHLEIRTHVRKGRSFIPEDVIRIAGNIASYTSGFLKRATIWVWRKRKRPCPIPSIRKSTAATLSQEWRRSGTYSLAGRARAAETKPLAERLAAYAAQLRYEDLNAATIERASNPTSSIHWAAAWSAFDEAPGSRLPRDRVDGAGWRDHHRHDAQDFARSSRLRERRRRPLLRGPQRHLCREGQRAIRAITSRPARGCGS